MIFHCNEMVVHGQDVDCEKEANLHHGQGVDCKKEANNHHGQGCGL